MRIALIIYGDISSVSGGYLYDRKLLEYLQNHDEEIELISLKNRGFLKALFNFEIPAELRSRQFDVLIQDELVHPAMLGINRKLKSIFRCKLVSLVHLFNSSRPVPKYQQYFYQLVEKQYLKHIDALILNSQSTLSQAQQLIGKKLPPHIVAPPCGDNFGDVATGRSEKSSDTLKLLYVGNIIRQKGLHVLLQGFAKLKLPGLSLTVVGRSELEPGYALEQQAFVKNHELSGKVNFLGVLGADELAEIYREHDVFIMPSVNEAYGIVYLEAMQFGLPVIGTGTGGGREIIQEEHNGYLIEPEDSERLAEIIQYLATHPAHLHSLSANARQSYLLHPKWQDSCEKIHAFLQDLVSGKATQGVNA